MLRDRSETAVPGYNGVNGTRSALCLEQAPRKRGKCWWGMRRVLGLFAGGFVVFPWRLGTASWCCRHALPVNGAPRLAALVVVVVVSA